jgi:DNA topoisomerase-1
LTTLQTEAYRVAGINPKATLQIAQDLYSSGFISYPRTSSQQLPEKLDFAKIIASLGKTGEYAVLAKAVLKTSLKPHNGKKTDPAHPAIYPTGIVPRGMEGREGKVYDLIVKRFFSTFGEPAVRESVTMGLDVGGEPFVAKGTRTVKPNWHAWYAPFVKLEEVELPALATGDSVAVKELRFEEKATQPPKRFTPSSIIRELEKRNLGTKATRAEIISTLAERNYLIGESIQVTELGMKLVDILEKSVPTILDEELTRHFEEDMDAIRARAKKPELVLSEAREVLTRILHAFKEREALVGEQLRTTFSETKLALTKVGLCPRCREGSIVLRKGRFGRFIACDRYPECKTTFSLPRVGGVEVTDKSCPTCQYPMVLMIKKAKRPQEVCINLDCPAKQPPDFKEGPCPRCGTGKTILRRSVYGAFIACTAFPKCRYIAKAAGGKGQVGSPSTEVAPVTGGATAGVSSVAVAGAAKAKPRRKAQVKCRASKPSKAQAI